MPVYPSRLSPAGAGGFWLTAFTARTQLIEFVLREPAYRKRMMAEIDPEFWIAPRLSAQPVLQGPDAGRASEDHGGRQAVGAAAFLRAGDRLSAAGDPLYSLHSRVDGVNHGVVPPSKSAMLSSFSPRGLDAC